jgi:hypothetical protein
VSLRDAISMRGIPRNTPQKPKLAFTFVYARDLKPVVVTTSVGGAAHRNEVTHEAPRPTTPPVFAVERFWLADDPECFVLVQGADGHALLAYLAAAAAPDLPAVRPASFRDGMMALSVAAAKELRGRWVANNGRPYPIQRIVFERLSDLPVLADDVPAIFVLSEIPLPAACDVLKRSANRDRNSVLFSPVMPGFVLKLLRREGLLVATRM